MTTRMKKRDVLELQNGDRMTREEFHGAYEKTPEDFRAELIGGIVYVSSPLKIRHGSYHLLLGSLFCAYEANTPGVEASDNATVQLGFEGEPQPDLFLRILPEFGGQSRTSHDDYVEGAPELISEISVSSRSIDLHAKREDYQRYGVLEYLVLTLREKELRWFDLAGDKELKPDADGVLRLRTFPGLWIDAKAVIDKNHAKAHRMLGRGLRSADHTAFIARLAATQKSPRRGQK